jgi:hypothetical protein
MFPSFSSSYLTEKRTPNRIQSGLLNLSGINVVNNSPFQSSNMVTKLMNNLNTSTHRPSRFTEPSTVDYQNDYVKGNLGNIESKLRHLSYRTDTRTSLYNNMITHDKNIGIYNPFLGNPVIGTNPNTEGSSTPLNKTSSTVKSSKYEPIYKTNNTRLESLGYQQFLQDQLIQQRKEKLQENNFQINNLILQEIDEMADNLDIFKVEMFNHIKKLERRSDNQKFDELMEELDYMKGYVKTLFDKSERKQYRDVQDIKENMNTLKDDINEAMRNETEKNRNMVKGLTNEVRNNQEDINITLIDADENNRYRADRLKCQINRIRDDINSGGVRRTKGRREKVTEDEENIEEYKPRSYNDEEIDQFIKVNGMDKKRTKSMLNDEQLKMFIDKYKTTNAMATQDVIKETEEDDDEFDPNQTTNMKEKFKAKKTINKKLSAANLGTLYGNFTELNNYK